MAAASNQHSVLLINRVYPPARGASGRVLRDLAKAFARAGWRVSVLSGGPRKIALKDGAVELHLVKSRLSPDRTASDYARAWLRLLWAGLRLPPHDLVITLSDPPMLVTAGQIIGAVKKSRHIHWCHDLYPDLLPALDVRLPFLVAALLKRLRRGALKSCDRVVVIGRCMAAKVTALGVPPGRVSVIPNWPEAELVRPLRYGANKISGKISGKKRRGAGTDAGKDDGVDDGAGMGTNTGTDSSTATRMIYKDGNPKFRVLYAGNLGRAHLSAPLLEAAEALNAYPDIELVFVGDGRQFEGLAQERDRRGLQNIKFLPYQPASNLREVLLSADVHLVTQREATAGLLVPCKFYAALAVGRPCLYFGPERTEIAQILQEYKAGRIVSPQEGGIALAQEIIRMRQDPQWWFACQKGAARAGRIFVPRHALGAWLERAADVVSDIV